LAIGMESTAFIIVLSIAVIGVTAVLFVGWLGLMLLRLAGWIVGWPIGLMRGPWRSPTGLAEVACPRRQCRAKNPVVGRFCRRCGIALPRRRRRAAAVTDDRARPSQPPEDRSLSRPAAW
jgi:hypothetical protein